MWIRTIAVAVLAVLTQVPGERDAPATGTITVEFADDGTTPSPLRPAFVEAVQRALVDADFTVLPAPGHSRYIARVAVTQRLRGLAKADPDEAGPATNVGNWGARLRVTLPSDKTQTHGLVVTELRLAIVQRSTGREIWSGSAMTAEVQGTRSGAPSVVAQKLADALIQRFPAALEGPISVP